MRQELTYELGNVPAYYTRDARIVDVEVVGISILLRITSIINMFSRLSTGTSSSLSAASCHRFIYSAVAGPSTIVWCLSNSEYARKKKQLFSSFCGIWRRREETSHPSKFRNCTGKWIFWTARKWNGNYFMTIFLVFSLPLRPISWRKCVMLNRILNALQP